MAPPKTSPQKTKKHKSEKLFFAFVCWYAVCVLCFDCACIKPEACFPQLLSSALACAPLAASTPPGRNRLETSTAPASYVFAHCYRVRQRAVHHPHSSFHASVLRQEFVYRRQVISRRALRRAYRLRSFGTLQRANRLHDLRPLQRAYHIFIINQQWRHRQQGSQYPQSRTHQLHSPQGHRRRK